MREFMMICRILLWLSVFVCLGVPPAFGDEGAAQVVFRRVDGQVETRTVDLVSHGEVQHLRVPKQAIPTETRHIEVHHPIATAKAGEDGFYVPCNGMLGTYQDRPDATYRNPHVVMPVLGVSTPRGAMTVIVTGLRYEAFQMVDLKDGVYRVFPRFELNGDAPYDDLEIEFHRLDADRATYADMAKRYRRFQLDRQIVRPLKQCIQEHPELAYAASSMVVRVRLGWKPVPSPVPEQDAENEPTMKVAVSFDRLMRLIDEFKTQGIERAEFCLVGWNIGGHDGRYTTTTNSTIKDPRTQLKLIEFGGRPMFYFHSKFRDAGSHWMGDEDLTCATGHRLGRSRPDRPIDGIRNSGSSFLVML